MILQRVKATTTKHTKSKEYYLEKNYGRGCKKLKALLHVEIWA